MDKSSVGISDLDLAHGCHYSRFPRVFFTCEMQDKMRRKDFDPNKLYRVVSLLEEERVLLGNENAVCDTFAYATNGPSWFVSNIA